GRQLVGGRLPGRGDGPQRRRRRDLRLVRLVDPVGLHLPDLGRQGDRLGLDRDRAERVLERLAGPGGQHLLRVPRQRRGSGARSDHLHARRQRMRSRLAALAALILLPVALVSQPAYGAVGIHVDGTDIVERGGQKLILRGTSHPHAWYAGRTQAFGDIKSLGANAVRVVLSGGRWTSNDTADVANVVSLCKQNRLICVLENHDTTGYGEQSGAHTLDQAADYWISVKSALAGQEDYVVVNIGNEPIGNNPVTPGWAEATSAAIRKLRDNGFG